MYTPASKDIHMYYVGYGYTMNESCMYNTTAALSQYSGSEVSRSIWWHYLVINIPDQIDFKDTGLLYITASSNDKG